MAVLMYLLQGWARRENKHWHRHLGNLMISIFVFITGACWLCVLPLSGCVSPLSHGVSATGFSAFPQNHAFLFFKSFTPWRCISFSLWNFPDRPQSLYSYMSCGVFFCLISFDRLLSIANPLAVFRKKTICFPSFSCVCCHHDSDLMTTAEAADMTGFLAYLLSGIIIWYFGENWRIQRFYNSTLVKMSNFNSTGALYFGMHIHCLQVLFFKKTSKGSNSTVEVW